MRQKLNAYLRRVEAGETLKVAEWDRAVVIVAMLPEAPPPLGRLVTFGRAGGPVGDLPGPSTSNTVLNLHGSHPGEIYAILYAISSPERPKPRRRSTSSCRQTPLCSSSAHAVACSSDTVGARIQTMRFTKMHGCHC